MLLQVQVVVLQDIAIRMFRPFCLEEDLKKVLTLQENNLEIMKLLQEEKKEVMRHIILFKEYQKVLIKVNPKEKPA